MIFDPWHLSTLLGMVLVAVGSYFIPRRDWVKIPYFWILIFSMFVAFFQGAGQMTVQSYGSQAQAAKFALAWVLVPAFFMSISEKWALYLKRAFLLILALDCLWVCTSQPGEVFGLFIGVTQTALVGAIFLPLFIRDRYLVWASLPVFLAIQHTWSESAIVVLAIHAVVFYFKTVRNWKWDFVIAFGFIWMCAQIIMTGGFHSRLALINPTMSWWLSKNHVIHLAGTGPWSWEFLNLLFLPVQRMWLHSDWVQLLFEFGILGFTSFVLLASYALWKKRKDLTAVSILLSLYFGMLVYSPMQFFIVWGLLCLTLRGK